MMNLQPLQLCIAEQCKHRAAKQPAVSSSTHDEQASTRLHLRQQCIVLAIQPLKLS